MIALAEKDYDKAIAELQQANQQNPQDLYRLAQAYQGKGDNAKAKEFYAKAAGFNSLPQLNYAFVRVKVWIPYFDKVSPTPESRTPLQGRRGLTRSQQFQYTEPARTCARRVCARASSGV